MTGESVVSADVGGVGIWTGGDDFGGISTSSNVHGGGGIDDGDRRGTAVNVEVITLERKRRKKKKRRGRRRRRETTKKTTTTKTSE